MKKTLLILALSIMSLGVANAELFISGEVEIGYAENAIKVDGNVSGAQKNTSFDLAPKIGYMINEKLAVGAEISYGLENEREYVLKNCVSNVSTHALYAAPFARYYFFEHNKFAIFAEAKARMGGTIDSNPDTDNFRLTLSVAPYLEYNISEHFALEMGLKFLSLGYGYEADITKGAVRTVQETHAFLCGFTTENIFGTLGGLTIAAVYKF